MENKKRTLTMKDIAEELGVSVATVSRALKDSPRISLEMREKIQQYAKENHFSPNTLAESLRNSQLRPSKLIGVIVPEYNHDYFASVLSGIDEVVSANGYCIMVAASNEHFKDEIEICNRFLENRVCGVIISQSKETIEYGHFQRLIDSGLPVVFYDRICIGINASRVVVDDYQGTFNAVSYMIQTGCRRIAYYGSPKTLEISKNRYNGWRDALLKNGLVPEENLVFNCDSRQESEVLTHEILQRETIPDGFFAVNDNTAFGIIVEAKRMGYRIPQDISVCGFTNHAEAITCDPPLTTVEQHGREVGREAATILINKVEGKIPLDSVEKRIVRTKLVIRESTR